MNTTQSNTTGIVLMCVAMGLFSANDTIVKLTSETLTVPQIMLLRGIFVCLFTLVWVIAAGHGRAIVRLANPLVLFRSSFEAIAGITYFAALATMPIAEVTAVLLITPLLIAAGAALVYKEKLSFGGWAAIAVGFSGMLLIVQPGVHGFSGSTWVALLAAFAIAARDLTTRRIKSEVSSLVVCLGGGIAITTLGLVTTLGQWAAHPMTVSAIVSGKTLLGMFVAAIVVTIGNYGVILAFRHSSVQAVSPFRYSALIWAMLVGLIVWRETPDMLALTGSGLIIASGLYLLQSERIGQRRKQRALAKAATAGIPDNL